MAALALPDSNSLALDGVLAAEGADVAGVLGDFHLLHLLTQRGTVPVECQYLSIIQSFHIEISIRGSQDWTRDRPDGFEGVYIPGTIFTGDTDL